MITAHPRGWYHPVAIIRSIMMSPRIYFGLAAAAVAFFAVPSAWPGMVRSTIAWDAGGLTYLVFAARLMFTCGAENIKARAARRDDSRVVILVLILLAIAASFASIGGLIVHAKSASVDAEGKALLGVLAIVTIILSWSVTQVAFALHYAHEFYRPDPGSDAGSGFVFPGTEVPDYWDFLYFATSIGASSQTSDTSIRSRNLRRLVTLHAVIAFFFNTAVLALTVNIAASLAG
jgi:uncharacterized membrane protein